MPPHYVRGSKMSTIINIFKKQDNEQINKNIINIFMNMKPLLIFVLEEKIIKASNKKIIIICQNYKMIPQRKKSSLILKCFRY